ncbi:TRAP transporter substrate-binding protein [Chloroflexota bacterium]
MKNKRLFILISSVCLILAIALLPLLTACAEPAPPTAIKPIELSLSMLIPPTHARWTKAIEPWAAELEEKTGGKVKITPFFSNALAPAGEAFDAARTGICDIAHSFPVQTPGKFPLTMVAAVSPIGPYHPYPGRAIWELYKASPEFQKEYGGVKVLALASVPAMVPVTKTPIRTLDDWKGKKIVGQGTWGGAILTKLGASPSLITWGELYVALEKGVVDGVITSYDTLKSRKFAEVTSYVTAVSQTPSVYYFVMNLDTWNALPSDVQKVFDELSGDYFVDLLVKNEAINDEVATEWAAKEHDIEYIQVAPDELAKWIKLTEPVADEWVSEMEGKGYPAREFYNKYVQLYEKNRP